MTAARVATPSISSLMNLGKREFWVKYAEKVIKTHLKNNRTMRILHRAEIGKYAVPSVNCYNTEGLFAAVRAAEARRSPVIVEVFPWSIEQFGPHFVRMCAEVVKSASVPMALHLDNAHTPSILDQVLGWHDSSSHGHIFDSIMVDLSGQSEEDRISATRQYVEQAVLQGIAVEAVLGRIDGTEDGVAAGSDGATVPPAALTNAADAKRFVRKTGVQMIAPAFGNVLGEYGRTGPRASLDLEMLEAVKQSIRETGASIVVHGTDGFDEKLFQDVVTAGARKVNVNKVVSGNYLDFTEQNFGCLPLTEVIERGIDQFQGGIEHTMDWLGSSGKADL